MLLRPSPKPTPTPKLTPTLALMRPGLAGRGCTCAHFGCCSICWGPHSSAWPRRASGWGVHHMQCARCQTHAPYSVRCQADALKRMATLDSTAPTARMCRPNGCARTCSQCQPRLPLLTQRGVPSHLHTTPGSARLPSQQLLPLLTQRGVPSHLHTTPGSARLPSRQLLPLLTQRGVPSHLHTARLPLQGSLSSMSISNFHSSPPHPSL